MKFFRGSACKLFFILPLLLGWIGVVSIDSMAASKTPLLAEQAFVFSASVTSHNQIMAEWRLAPGYYLYAKRLHVSLTPAIPMEVQIPPGKIKFDQSLGKQEIFYQQVQIPIQLKSPASTVELKVEYQGCSEGGFCYPPMQKSVTLHLIGAQNETLSPAASSPSFSWALLTDQNRVVALLDHSQKGSLLFIFLGLGLLLAFTPCVLPMIPIITGIIVGQKETVSTKKAFVLSSVYVLGSALTYAMAGLLAAYMGSSLQAWLQKPWMIASVSILFFLLSLSLFGFYELTLPARWQNRLMHLSNKQQAGRYTSVFIMGMLSSLIVSPCVTAPLIGVLLYMAQTGDLLLSASSLFAMGVGMGIPLILIGLSAGKWLPKTGPWMQAIKKLFGILMLAMAVWLLSRMVSPLITHVLFSVLLLLTALFLGWYLPRIVGRPFIHRSLGVMVAVSSMVMLTGGGDTSLLMQLFSHQQQRAQVSLPFTLVHTLPELKQQLAMARKENKPAIVDFYADWCESCKEMDSAVFAHPDVSKVLSHYVLLRADVTANNAHDREILKHFHVIAPPTVLFFNAKGREESLQRIVGEVNKSEFLSRVNGLDNALALKK